MSQRVLELLIQLIKRVSFSHIHPHCAPQNGGEIIRGIRNNTAIALVHAIICLNRIPPVTTEVE